MSRIFGKLFEMTDTLSNQIHIETDQDATDADDGVESGPDARDANGVAANTAGAADGPAEEETATADLLAVAEQFNAAFNTTLYEIESARTLSRERAARIEELNESIRIINSKLEEETSRGRKKDEEHARKAEQLGQSIQQLESERERLQQQTIEQEAALNAGTEEAGRLSRRIDELGTSLEQHKAEGQHTREELAREKQALTGSLNELSEKTARIEELNESIRIINSNLEEETSKSRKKDEEHARTAEDLGQRIQQLESERERLQQQTIEQEAALNAGTEEAGKLSQRIDELSRSLEQHKAEGQHASEEFERHREALTRSLDELQEKYVAACNQFDNSQKEREELSRQHESEIDAQQAANNKLAAHVEKLQNLNRALHESVISDDELHEKMLEQKDREIETLRNCTGNEETEELNTALREAESRLAEAEAQCQMFQERSGLANELESEIARLGLALQEAGNATHADTANTQALNERVVGLESALDTARVECEALASKLFSHEALKREVASLRETLHQANSKLQEQNAASSSVDALHSEVASINAALQSACTERDALAEKLADHEVLEAEVAILRADLQQASQKLQEQDATSSSVDAMHSEVASINAALQSACAERDALAVKLADHEVLEAEVTILRADLQQTNQQLQEQNAAGAALDSLQNEVASTNAALQSACAERDAFAGKLAGFEALEGEVASLRADLQQANQQLQEQNAAGADIGSLQNEVASTNAALQSACAERDAFAGKLTGFEALEAEVASLRADLQQANQQLREQNAADPGIDALHGEITSLKSALGEADEKYAQLQGASRVTPVYGSATGLAQHAVAAAETPDREQFVYLLNDLLAEPDGTDKNKTVMYILLDNFIRIRDEIGIMNSENVIKETTSIFAQQCDESDIISRFGDYTFVILTKDTDKDMTREKAEKIRTAVESKIFDVAGHSVLTSTSIGICSIRDDDDSAEMVIARADLACESARTSGGNQVLVGSTVTCGLGLHGHNDKHPEIVSQILDDNRIKIYYQSISSLKNMDVHCYEVLTRIVDERGNIILPGEFFSMAVNSGKAMDVDLHVVENIMRMMDQNRDRPMKLFIKLTRQSVASEDFAFWLMEKIKEYRIIPEMLVFEVAESLLQNELKNLSMLSMALHKMGCKVAIEHYRMSTQPQHLRHVHTDYLKIDSGLIQNIGSKGKCLEKVTDIMEIARRNEYITIAEGVESPACLAMLWELGVNLAQGYFIQAPAGDMDINVKDIEFDVDDDKEENSNRATYTLG